MTDELAIVIPAYKKDFFAETLRSIASQTCKKFTLYIGDDASPDNLHTIIDGFENEIKIVYKQFSENLGGKDLVAHWSRCIDLVQDEEWIWLFSDDDVMEENCVENFYGYLKKNIDSNLFHFNIDIIDYQGKITKECNGFPECISVTDFFSKRIKFKINSTVVEYIFRKSTYYQEGKFKQFDMAWCSDDATWIKFGHHGGMVTIPEAKVKWRYSGLNISSDIHTKGIVLKKLDTNISYINWAKEYFTEQRLKDNTTEFEKFKWVISTIVISSVLSFKEKYRLISKVSKELHYSNIKIPASIYLFYWEIKKINFR